MSEYVFAFCLDPYHPVKSDDVFAIAVEKWHMTIHHLTHRVDVPPRSPSLVLCRWAVKLHPKNVDLADNPPHQLHGTWRRDRMEKREEKRSASVSETLNHLIFNSQRALHFPPYNLFLSVRHHSADIGIRLSEH